MVHVGNKAIRGYLACGQCIKHRNERCIQDDEVNEWIQKMKTADGILIGSPVHFSAIGGTMKSFLDRAFYVTRRQRRHAPPQGGRGGGGGAASPAASPPSTS